MSTGDRIVVMEDNLMKIWVFMNHNELKDSDEDRKKLLEMIREYFKEPINQDLPNLEKINEQIAHIKETLKIDLIDIVKDFGLGREENGGAHKVTTPTGDYVFPDPR